MITNTILGVPSSKNGGSRVVIGGVISPLIRVVSAVTLLITPRIITVTHEPPSNCSGPYSSVS